MNTSLKADGLLVGVTLLAAAGWVFSLFTLRGLPSLYFVGFRFLIAGTTLVIFAIRPLLRLGIGDWMRGAATGVTMFLCLTLWTMGLLQTDNIGVGAFICSLGNILAPFLGWILFRIRVSALTWGAASIAALGMACLSLQGNIGFSLANLFFLGSALSGSLYLNLNNHYVQRLPVIALATVQIITVGVLAIGMAPFYEHWPETVSRETIGWLLASALIATSLRYFLLVKGQKAAVISHTALIMNLEPVWTAIIAVFLLQSPMNGPQILGCSLIFIALVFNRVPWGLMIHFLRRRLGGCDA